MTVYTLWDIGVDPNPASTNVSDSDVNLGVEFYSSEDIDVTGVAFWKEATGSKTFTVGIFNANSPTVLETGGTTTSVGNQWVAVDLDAPLAITANTRYIAVVLWTGGGGYSVTSSAWGTDLVSGVLTAPSQANSTHTAQGLFNYNSALTRPTSAFNQGNYWVTPVADDGAGAGVTGTLAETQDAQTLAASGAVVNFIGSIAETQAGDTVSASGAFTDQAPQFVRPNATLNAGDWTAVGAASLHAAVDEETASFDDYIRPEDQPSTSPVVLGLGVLAEPETVNDGDVVLHVQYDKEGPLTTSLVIELRQGYVNEGSPGTLIATTTDSGVTDATEDGVLSLTALEFANIVFASGIADDLGVRLVADT